MTLPLSVSTEDRRCSARVAARLVRIVQSQDIWSGTAVAGVAFQFLPATAVEQNAVQDLVLHAARSQVKDRREVEVEHSFDAVLAHGADGQASATVRRVNLGGMSIETNWRVDPGQVVRVEIPTPDGVSVQFAGCAAVVQQADGGTYQVDVEFEDRNAMPSLHPDMAGSVENAVTTFIERMLVPSSPPQYTGDLAGKIEALAPPTLLSLLELSEMTGLLTLRSGDEEGRVFVRRGQVVDVELSRGGSGIVRDDLAVLCGWTEGSFDFGCQDVERENQLEMRTSAVLIDIARIQDEINNTL